jgi:hypothetical protein
MADPTIGVNVPIRGLAVIFLDTVKTKTSCATLNKEIGGRQLSQLTSTAGLVVNDKCLTISVHTEICICLETWQKSFECYFCCDGLKIETWIENLFLADMASMMQTLPKVTPLLEDKRNYTTRIKLGEF